MSKLGGYVLSVLCIIALAMTPVYFAVAEKLAPDTEHQSRLSIDTASESAQGAMFTHKGINENAVESLFGKFTDRSIDWQSVTMTQGALRAIFGNINLFEPLNPNSQAVGVDLFTYNSWLPVRLENGILTVWMIGGYAWTPMSNDGNSNYNYSIPRARVVSDLDSLLSNQFSEIPRGLFVPMNEVPWQVNQVATRGFTPSVTSDIIWIPSDAEIVDNGYFGFTDSAQRVPSPNLTAVAWVRTSQLVGGELTNMMFRINRYGQPGGVTDITAGGTLRPAIHIDLNMLNEIAEIDNNGSGGSGNGSGGSDNGNGNGGSGNGSSDNGQAEPSPTPDPELVSRIEKLEQMIYDLEQLILELTEQLQNSIANNELNAEQNLKLVGMIADMIGQISDLQSEIVYLRRIIDDIEREPIIVPPPELPPIIINPPAIEFPPNEPQNFLVYALIIAGTIAFFGIIIVVVLSRRKVSPDNSGAKSSTGSKNLPFPK